MQQISFSGRAPLGPARGAYSAPIDEEEKEGERRGQEGREGEDGREMCLLLIFLLAAPLQNT